MKNWGKYLHYYNRSSINIFRIKVQMTTMHNFYLAITLAKILK